MNDALGHFANREVIWNLSSLGSPGLDKRCLEDRVQTPDSPHGRPPALLSAAEAFLGLDPQLSQERSYVFGGGGRQGGEGGDPGRAGSWEQQDPELPSRLPGLDSV